MVTASPGNPNFAINAHLNQRLWVFHSTVDITGPRFERKRETMLLFPLA